MQYFISRGDEFLGLMPWPRDFENEKYERTEFTNLVALSYASSGVPLGIILPNLDEVREDEGFKNLFLNNSITRPKQLPYFPEEEAENLIKYFEQVQFHNIVFKQHLAYSSGKILQKSEKGTLNFDLKKTVDPLTKKPVAQFYKENETWQSVFQALAVPYEECRANALTLYFSTVEKSYEVLQPQFKDSWNEIAQAAFINWINLG